jgi:hypothetical protein
MGWACGTNGRKKRRVVGMPEGNRVLGRPRRRWQNSFKMISGSGNGFGNWTELAQDRDIWWILVSMLMNLPVP